MNSKRFPISRKDILSTLLYVAILVMGALFILDSAFILEVSFYVVGGGIIAISLYMLISLMIYKNKNREILRNSFFRLTLIIMMMIGGVAIIVYSNQGISFYQDVLASIFFFRSIYRFFYAYISKKTKRNTAAIIFVILAIIGLALSAFFTFYHESTKVIGICAGIAVILEGLYGLYRIWFPVAKAKLKDSSGGNKRNPPPRYQNSESEIIITDYEIVNNNKNDNSDDSLNR